MCPVLEIPHRTIKVEFRFTPITYLFFFKSRHNSVKPWHNTRACPKSITRKTKFMKPETNESSFYKLWQVAYLTKMYLLLFFCSWFFLLILFEDKLLSTLAQSFPSDLMWLIIATGSLGGENLICKQHTLTDRLWQTAVQTDDWTAVLIRFFLGVKLGLN